MKTAGAILAMAACCGAASAGQVVQSGALTSSTTNWSRTFDVQQFDDQGGALTLESVVIEIVSAVTGTAKFENRDTAARTISTSIDAAISIRLAGTPVIETNPSMSGVYDVSGFDGVIDFGGTSGRTLTDLADSRSASATLLAGVDDLTAWIGGGTLELTGVATALSSATGGGNLLALFQTQAGFDWTVTYNFRGAVVPTPTAALLGTAGLAGVAGLRRRRG